MTIYSKTGKGFRYDFMVKGKRYTKAWFRTKREAQAAQAQRKKEVAKADGMAERNDMGLLDMLNRRLDTLLERSFSTQYYKNTRYAAQRLFKHFGDVPCSSITSRMADDYLLSRSRSSTPLAANADLLLLRATFAWAMKRGQRFIADNPFAGLESFPSHLAEKKLKRMVDGPYTKGRYSMLKTACKKAGVGYYSFHRFRASGASVMDNNGALISGIQHLLGHADRRSTEIYLEKLRNVERDAMAIYEAQSRHVA